jgi:hypothetical protein
MEGGFGAERDLWVRPSAQEPMGTLAQGRSGLAPDDWSVRRLWACRTEQMIISSFPHSAGRLPLRIDLLFQTMRCRGSTVAHVRACELALLRVELHLVVE